MRLIIVGAVLLSAIIVAGTGVFLSTLRSRVLLENERELANTALILAKQIEHVFNAVETVQKGVVEQIAELAIPTREDYERQMSHHDMHLKLRDKAAGMLFIGSLTIVNAQGKVINFSRQWPVPAIDTSDRDFFKAFQSDPQLTSFLSQPVLNRATGTWVMHLARKILGPNGEFRGLISGAMELQYFQDFFGNISLAPDSSIAMLRQDGTLLVRHPTIEADIGRRFPNALALGFPSNADHVVGVSPGMMDGHARTVAGHRVDRYPVVLAVTKTVTTVLANWQRTATYLAAIAFLMIVAIASIAFLFIKLFGNYQTLMKTRAAQAEAKILREQSLHFEAALGNMSQGLVLFNAAGEMVICNDRYRQIYSLSLEQSPPGCTILELIRSRARSETFSGNPEDYVGALLTAVASGKISKNVTELKDGRVISVVNSPMDGGGWVATHEDITESIRREASFRLLFDNNPMAMWVFDCDSLRFLAVNDAAVAQYGYNHAQFLAMTVLDVCPVADRAKFEQFWRTKPRTQSDANVWQHRKSDGSEIAVSIYSQSLIYAGHTAELAAVHDVTKQTVAEGDLRRTRIFLDAVIDHVPLPILVKDVPKSATDAADCRYTLINKASEVLMGDARSGMIGKTAREIYPKERADVIIASDNETLRAEQSIFLREHPVATAARGNRVVTARKVAIRDDDGKAQYLLTVLDDVTERVHADQRIAHMAHHDALTGLPNRAAFNEYFSATLEHAETTREQFAILSVDFDRFKEANDIYGHTVGDALLREAARRIKAAADGVFLARLGGDEFMLVATGGPQPATAEALGARLLAAFVDDFEVDGHRLKLGLSVGGALYPNDGVDAKTLMVNADAALYRAKAESRGSMRFFEAEMAARLRERRDLEHDLRSAVGRNELFLHYQPQKTIFGETIGFEALVRWQCPKRGMVGPATFIPIAEETDLIIPVGTWVLRQACREAASWPLPLTIAVNISPVQVRHGDLAGLVHSILLETGLAPARLELEITEGVLIDDFSRAVSVLRKLKSLGVQIALDDFGSGYSSMSYVHAFRFDKIKIDRTFVGDLEHNRHSMAIVRAVIGLGHSLGVPILAEGVETDAQHAFLAKEGCDEMQGYLTGRPLPIADYAEMVGFPGIAKKTYAAAD